MSVGKLAIILAIKLEQDHVGLKSGFLSSKKGVKFRTVLQVQETLGQNIWDNPQRK